MLMSPLHLSIQFTLPSLPVGILNLSPDISTCRRKTLITCFLYSFIKYSVLIFMHVCAEFFGRFRTFNGKHRVDYRPN